MLYNSFRVTFTLASLLAVINMIGSEEYKYIYFPLIAIVWSVFSFFEDNDKEYRRRNGIDSFSIFSWTDDYYGYPNGYYNNSNTHNRSYDNSRYAPTTYNRGSYTYKDPSYKTIAKKCNRNFKITVVKEDEEPNGEL